MSYDLSKCLTFNLSLKILKMPRGSLEGAKREMRKWGSGSLIFIPIRPIPFMSHFLKISGLRVKVI